MGKGGKLDAKQTINKWEMCALKLLNMFIWYWKILEINTKILYLL